MPLSELEIRRIASMGYKWLCAAVCYREIFRERTKQIHNTASPSFGVFEEKVYVNNVSALTSRDQHRPLVLERNMTYCITE
jgi:hypothetical protein